MKNYSANRCGQKLQKGVKQTRQIFVVLWGSTASGKATFVSCALIVKDQALKSTSPVQNL